MANMANMTNMTNMGNKRFPHHKYNNNTQGIMISSLVQQKLSNGLGKKAHFQQKSLKNNSMFTDNVPCQPQFNNQKSISLNSQLTPKQIEHIVNSCAISQKKKKKKNSKLLSSKPHQNNNKRSKPSQDSSQPLPYALKNEVPAGLPRPLCVSRQGDCDFRSSPTSHNHHDGQEQSQIHGASFESSGFSCCKSLAKSENHDVSNISQYYEIKLPGMLQFVLVPKRTIEKTDHDVVSAFLPPKIHIDYQSLRVKLPGVQNNPVLCDEPWWLSPKESSAPSHLTVKKEEISSQLVIKQVPSQLVVKQKVPSQFVEKNITAVVPQEENISDNVNEEYESSHAMEVQLGVKPIVRLPSWSPTRRLCQRKKVNDYFQDYLYFDHFHVTTSNGFEFDKEPPVVRLCPKQKHPSSRSDLPNLKIDVSLKLDKDDDFRSALDSTLSTPVSEISSSFSHMSTYAESENTVFTEDDETKSCNASERRSPSVLSDFSLSPVLEEEEEEVSKASVEKHSKGCLVDGEQEILESNTYSHSEDSESQELNHDEDPESQELNHGEDPESWESNHSEDSDRELEVSNEKTEYILPELKKIAEQLDTLSDSKETIRIRRQLETMRKENYPASLPLSNKWTMYFADTSTTKNNTRIISKNKYSSTLNPIFECTTVPDLCSNLREISSKIKPSDMRINANLSFFKGNIKPMWEDEANHKGGRFTLCPPRFQLNSLWDSIVLLLAGETIDDNLICGAICARRERGDRIELWISGDAYSDDIDRIRDRLAEEFGKDMIKSVKYKKHLVKP